MIKSPKVLSNWIIIELTNFVAVGNVEDRGTIYTDKILAIVDGYLVTHKDIFKLGKPDKIWMTTPEAKAKLEMFDDKNSLHQ